MNACRTGVAIAFTLAAGSLAPAPEAQSASAEEARLVFVSTVPTQPGFLGGMTGADLACRESAEARGLEGVFLAFLGDGAMGPANRFDPEPRPLVNTNGQHVAADWRSLAAGTTVAPILRLDGTRAPVAPWTNVGADGRSDMLATTCDRWWKASHRHAGGVGIATRTVASCDSARPFVCVQQ